MLYSDVDLRAALDDGSLRIDPLDSELIQPSSVDVRLGVQFLTFNGHMYSHIDPAKEQSHLTSPTWIGDHEAFYLQPGEFALASTMETFTLGPSIAGRLEGKSSLGRLGLLVHSTAGFIDPGFSGTITLELSNAATLPIKLYAGMRIGQLCVFELKTPAKVPYGSSAAGSRYQGQRGPVPSRAHQQWRTWTTDYYLP